MSIIVYTNTFLSSFLQFLDSDSYLFTSINPWLFVWVSCFYSLLSLFEQCCFSYSQRQPLQCPEHMDRSMHITHTQRFSKAILAAHHSANSCSFVLWLITPFGTSTTTNFAFIWENEA